MSSWHIHTLRAPVTPNSPLSYFEELAERLPNGQSTILPNLGHLLVMEDPKRTGTPAGPALFVPSLRQGPDICCHAWAGVDNINSALDPRLARP